MMTGDASINRDAPDLCCTAEILSNLALREGDQADVDMVVMDEFHYYGDRDRGVAWQVPLLTLPQARFLLMSATLGDTARFEESISRSSPGARGEVKTMRPPGAARLGVLREALHETLLGLLEAVKKRPSTWCTSRSARRRAGAGPDERSTSCSKEEKAAIKQDALTASASTAPSAPSCGASCTTASGCTTRAAAQVPARWSSGSRSRGCSRSSAAPTRSASA
jgi:hypothetical protein